MTGLNLGGRTLTAGVYYVYYNVSNANELLSAVG